MKKNLQQAIIQRRSYYHISNKSTISNQEIKTLIDFALKHVPSAYNSQSARTVLLLGEQHIRVWEIVKNISEKTMSRDSFETTKAKIESCFQTGYGTILFFEDIQIINKLQSQFPKYSEKFTVWSDESSGMLQYAIWLLLKDAGMGASLQHYNPLIDHDIAEEWKLSPEWKLKAQMPFGIPTAEPDSKDFDPIINRSLLFE